MAPVELSFRTPRY